MELDVARLAYSDRELPQNTRENLEAFWDRIIDVPTRKETEDYVVME